MNKQFDSDHFLTVAINTLLQTIGELPIDTLADVANVLEAQIAETDIIEAKKLILAQGWDVNTDTGYPFYPTQDGYIAVPADILDLRSGKDIIVRDWQLYNKATHSRKFTEVVNCDVMWNLDFNTLPHPLRYYITLEAARKYQMRMISDTNMYTFTQDDVAEAKMFAKQSNGFTEQFNMLDTVEMKSL